MKSTLSSVRADTVHTMHVPWRAIANVPPPFFKGALRGFPWSAALTAAMNVVVLALSMDTLPLKTVGGLTTVISWSR